MSNGAPLKINDEIAGLIAGAYDSGHVLLVAAVDGEGKPQISFRGSVAVYGDDQLSFWARNPIGGTVEAIRHNPHVALMYRAPKVPLLKFTGRARVAETGAENNRAYGLAHAKEQAADADRGGVAVIIDLDEIVGAFIRDEGREFVRLVRV
jgi:hypothetical protein